MKTEIFPYSIDQYRQAFKQWAVNQRNCDKFSLAYYVGMCDFHSCMHLWPEAYKRQEIIDRLFKLLEEDKNMLKLIDSEWLAAQITPFIK